MAPRKKISAKGEATRARIVDAAAACLARYGEKGTTFQRVADLCGVSQTLVVHYFKTSKNIFKTVVQTRMRDVQTRSQAAIEAAGDSPRAQLAAYLAISLAIFRERPENAKIYLELFYQGAFDPAYTRVNEELRAIAVARIRSIVEAGIARGEFRCASPELAAKCIHNALVGNLLAQVTERGAYRDADLLATLTRACTDFLHGDVEIAPPPAGVGQRQNKRKNFGRRESPGT